ncbi:hypothetical protein [Arthrobacter rhombi]|uniref:hypothetical protein n=1 Tax=Arthrobacter rhombi TaxID=71253 RepID=UPI003FD00983
MKRTGFAAVLAIAVLSASACTSESVGNSSADGLVGGSPTSAATKAAPTQQMSSSEMPSTGAGPTSMFKTGQAWADDAYESWFEGMQTTYIDDSDVGFCPPFDDLKGYRECLPNDPHAYVESFTSTEPGHLVVTLSPDSRWQGGEYDTDGISGLEFVAGNVGPRLQQDGFPFLKVTAKISGTDKSSTYELFPSKSGR